MATFTACVGYFLFILTLKPQLSRLGSSSYSPSSFAISDCPGQMSSFELIPQAVLYCDSRNQL